MLQIIRLDPGHLGRADGLGNEGGRVIVPGDDIDTLIAQLADDILHADAFQTHAGAHRIDPGVIGGYRDLGTIARLTGNGLDLHDPFVDLGNFQLE